MKKSTIIILCIIILAVITASSFAIYKSTLSGNIEADCAEVIAEVVTQEPNSVVINTTYLTLEYDFEVNNYITENSNSFRNQTICDYYIKISGLENNVFINNVKLYYIDPNAGGTELSLITEGEFNGFYQTNKQLVIDSDTSHAYKLQITILQANLIDLTTSVHIDIGYEQNIEIEQYLNSPDLGAGMIPVAWDDVNDVWVKTDSTNVGDCWYNYYQKKWANVVTALNNYNDGINTGLSYLQAPNGTTIPYSDITTMFVWIPRFVYRIDENYYHKTILEGSGLTEPPVEIHFSKTESTGGDSWDENIIVVNSGIRAADCKNGWTTHSAFTFGDTYLNGLWVAKFQASSDTSNNINIKAAVQIKSNISLESAFSFSRNMETKSLYGWGTSSNLQQDATFSTDNNGLDIHLIKNSEWSAMAFLTHSKYGQGLQNIKNYLTSYDDYCGKSTTPQEVFNIAKTGQSTTNNAYGIYDTASTLWNWVSAYIGDSSTTNLTILLTALPKYKDVYLAPEGVLLDHSNKNSVYSIFENIKDAAIWETSVSGNESQTTWFSGCSNIGMLVSGKYNQLIVRGAQYNGTNSIFAFGYGDATEASSLTRAFRPVIAVKTGI